jgi:hypothetical protein
MFYIAIPLRFILQFRGFVPLVSVDSDAMLRQIRLSLCFVAQHAIETDV